MAPNLKDGEAVRGRGSARDYLESAKTDADNLPAGAEHGQPKGRMNRGFELDRIMSESLSAELVLSIENARPTGLGNRP